MSTRRNPFAALLLSLIVPGLGQIYNKEPTKGIVVMSACLGLGLLAYALPGLHKVTAALLLLVVWISVSIEAYKIAQASGQPVDFYYRTPFVVGMLLVVGPLALPLLWKSPYFSRVSRWTWTIIVVGVALLFVATPYVLNWMIEWTPQLAPILAEAAS